jgi:hypothetical protein
MLHLAQAQLPAEVSHILLVLDLAALHILLAAVAPMARHTVLVAVAVPQIHLDPVDLD